MSVALRVAGGADDRDFYWRVNGDVGVRQNSLRPQAIAWETHCTWWERNSTAADIALYVVMAGDVRVGVLRLNGLGTDELTVSLAMLPEWRGRGFGAEAIKAAVSAARAFEARELKAVCKVENTASVKAFRKAGFQLAETTEREGCAVHVLAITP